MAINPIDENNSNKVDPSCFTVVGSVKVYKTYTDMIDDDFPGNLSFVIDATDDPTVEKGAAIYCYIKEQQTFKKLFESSDPDINIKPFITWANLLDKPNSSVEDIDTAVENNHNHDNINILNLIKIEDNKFMLGDDQILTVNTFNTFDSGIKELKIATTGISTALESVAKDVARIDEETYTKKEVDALLEGKSDALPVGVCKNIYTVCKEISENIRNMYISFNDPEDITLSGQLVSEWKCTKLVRKEGGYPTSPTDGIEVFANSERNQYSERFFIDQLPNDGKTYYYQLFPYSKQNRVNTDPANRFESREFTLADIHTALNKNRINEILELGDVITTTSSLGDISFEIAKFDAYHPDDVEHSILLISKNVVAQKKFGTGNTYKTSLVADYLNSIEFKNSFTESEFVDRIKECNILGLEGCMFFVPSMDDISGVTAKNKHTLDGVSSYWYTRSKNQTNLIGFDGSGSNTVLDPTSVSGVVIGCVFC